MDDEHLATHMNPEDKSVLARDSHVPDIAASTVFFTVPDGFLMSGAALISVAEFFLNELRTDHTRTAYGSAIAQLLAFVSTRHHVDRLDAITPIHIGAWVEHLKSQGLATPTIKLRIAAVRRVFGWLVAFRVLDTNPAAWIKTALHTITKGKTPVLTGEEMASLLRSIDTSTLIGLRDRTMIAAMAYSFARIGAVIALKSGDVFHQQNRLWLRLSEKRGRCIDVPCHPRLQESLSAWLKAAGEADNPNLPVFRTFDWEPKKSSATPETSGAAPVDASTCDDADTSTSGSVDRPKRKRILTRHPMTQAMAWEMLQRRAKAAGIATHVTCHTFRATGITAYLTHGGTLERAAAIAGHATMQTTKLYDRRSDHVTTDEIDKIVFA